MARSSASASFVVALALTLLGSTKEARAYCRTSSCAKGTGSMCAPAQPTDCGKPLFWSSPCIGYSLASAASKQVPLATAETIFRTAFDGWMKVACPAGGGPRIDVTDMGAVACAKHEYNQTSGNANIIAFRDDTWPYGSASTLALTTVSYNVDTGEIYDADMEINTADNMITLGDTMVGYDLASIAQHETGHFLGLSHSADPSATMFFNYKPGSTTLRTLEADDTAGICTIYPPGALPGDCTPEIRHGFSSECGAAATTGGCCTIAPGATRTGDEGLLLAVAGLGVAFARRKRR
jgi:MYXO-CTERM domain-containing protein